MRRMLMLVLLSFPFFLANCATSPPPQKTAEGIFYPAPPGLPRLQFLRSFNGSADVVPRQSAFDSFVIGNKKDWVLNKPYGIAARAGKIYVCDTNATVFVFDLNRNTFTTLPGAKGPGKLIQPLNISIDKEGNQYVADPVRKAVLMYNPQGVYIKDFVVPGSWKPTDAEAHEKLLYVTDAKNAEVKVFELDNGRMVRTFGEGDLGIPTNITIDGKGSIYVSDAGRFQVVKFDRDGHLLSEIGRPGKEPGAFARPRGIATDKSGHIYAVDAAFDNVQIFSEEGGVLLPFGSAGKKPGDLYLPAGVWIDESSVKYFEEYIDPDFKVEHLVFVTSQFGEQKVNVYAYGRDKTREYPSLEELKENAIKEWRKIIEEEETKTQDKQARNE